MTPLLQDRRSSAPFRLFFVGSEMRIVVLASLGPHDIDKPHEVSVTYGITSLQNLHGASVIPMKAYDLANISKPWRLSLT